MARKIDPNKFGSSRPKIEPDDLEGDAAILTVTECEETEPQKFQDGSERASACLKFRETGDKVLWLNKTMLVSLVEQLGDNPDKWAGEKVPVEVRTVNNPRTGKGVKKVYVMDAEEWDAAFKEAGVRRGGGTARRGR